MAIMLPKKTSKMTTTTMMMMMLLSRWSFVLSRLLIHDYQINSFCAPGSAVQPGMPERPSAASSL